MMEQPQIQPLFNQQTEVKSLFERRVKPSRLEFEAKMILQRLFEHDQSMGANVCEISGMPGSAKSAVMLSFVNYTILHHPNEKIFWSSAYGAPIDAFKLGRGKFRILVKEGSDVYFYDRINDCEVELDVIRFTDFDDCYKKCKPGICNVVFFGQPRTIWMEWIEYIKSRPGWHHVYVDEFSEVCPGDVKGKLFHRIAKFANYVVGQLRKCNCNLFYNSQSYGDISYRVRRKLTIRIFMPGAKADRKTRITQKAIDNLQRSREYGNQAYLDYGGVFGKTQFTDIFEPIAGVSVDARRRGMTTVLMEGEADEE